MKRTLMSILAVFFPWMVFLMDDNPGAAFVALIMQATVIGWPFATAWAWKIARSPEKKTKK
jgi:hypothetical protein